MAAAISAADRSLDLVISLSSWQTRYSGYLITRLAFEPRYSGTRQLFSNAETVTRSGFDFFGRITGNDLEFRGELTPIETFARFESEHGPSNSAAPNIFYPSGKLSGSISSLL